MTSRTIKSPGDILRLAADLAKLPLPLTVSWVQGEDRTKVQNALIHQWFGQIAKHYGDRTAGQVKGQCHHEYGLPIRLRDPVFNWTWARISKELDYEKQCKFFEREILPMSSAMKVPELSEYMTAMALHYRGEGVYLTDPELRKYEEDAPR